VKDYYAIACAMVRDELDLREWAAYHLTLGFEHLFVYDNESRVPVAVTLGDFVASGQITVFTVRGRFKQCNVVYPDVVERCRGRVRWVAFMDADEFLLPHHVDDIRLYLSGMERFSGVGVNWQIFGDNDHVDRPAGLLIENYTRRGAVDYAENEHVKSIVNPAEVLWPVNPHAFHLRDSRRMVDGDGRPYPPHFKHRHAFRNPPAVSQIQINHYYTRSLEDFRRKQDRGGGDSVTRRADEVFQKIHELCNEERDERIFRFRDATRLKMRELMGARELPNRLDEEGLQSVAFD